MLNNVVKNLQVIPVGVGTLSLAVLAYLYYVKRCYNYLKSFGYDSPPPKFFFGNLLEFLSPDSSTDEKQQSHYSKTLRNWTKTYGKIYGFYEGHSPVLVIADPDLVTEIFVNQSKLVSYRRSFPMSKKSHDPNADIFTSNGIRWVRVRYALEKVMLNNKNTVKCLEYADQSFLNTFIRQSSLEKLNENYDIYENVRLLMVQTMFTIIFGSDLKFFFKQDNELFKKFLMNRRKNQSFKDERLEMTKHVADKFCEAFEDFEKFSILKFVALMIPELEFLWISIAKFKKFFNSHIFRLSYFADPMDWFYINFIQKNLIQYIVENNLDNAAKNSTNINFNLEELTKHRQKLMSQSSSYLYSNNTNNEKKFNYFSSFLYLTFNRIIKYNPNEMGKLNTIRENSTSSFNRNRVYSTLNSSRNSSISNDQNPKMRSLSTSYFNQSSSAKQKMNKTRHYSNSNEEDLFRKSIRRSSNYLNNKSNTETESEDFENWRLTLNEALNNTLLMFFAGYETTSSAISFCFKIISSMPEQRDKLIEEIRENWDELSVNMTKYTQTQTKRSSSQISSEYDSEETENENDDLDDEVFEDPNDAKNKWNELYDCLEKLKYLDMFVREVLRMFPIANSMVSRKCVVDNLYIDNGNYFVPKGINIVVDVLSIHYDKTIWGPVDPEIFYPERFLTERNPAAWLVFGIGPRKCIAQKMAMLQIKLFIVRLLQNYEILQAKSDREKQIKKLSDLIKTKDVLFNAPVGGVYISIERKKLAKN